MNGTRRRRGEGGQDFLPRMAVGFAVFNDRFDGGLSSQFLVRSIRERRAFALSERLGPVSAPCGPHTPCPHKPARGLGGGLGIQLPAALALLL